MNKTLLPSLFLLLTACAPRAEAAPIPTANPDLLAKQIYETYDVGQKANINQEEQSISFVIPGGAQTNEVWSIFLLEDESMGILAPYSEFDLQNLSTETTREGSMILVSDKDGNQFLLTQEAVIVTMPDGSKLAVVDKGEKPDFSKSYSFAGLYNVVKP